MQIEMLDISRLPGAIEMCMDMKMLVLDIIYQGLLCVYMCVCTLYVFYSVLVCISKVGPSQSTIAYTRATCIYIHCYIDTMLYDRMRLYISDF